MNATHTFTATDDSTTVTITGRDDNSTTTITLAEAFDATIENIDALKAALRAAGWECDSEAWDSGEGYVAGGVTQL